MLARIAPLLISSMLPVVQLSASYPRSDLFNNMRIPAGAMFRPTQAAVSSPQRASARDDIRAQAERLVSEHRYEEARALLQPLQANNQDPAIESLLGQISVASREYRGGAIHFQRASELDPSEANLFDYGMTLFHLDRASSVTILRYR